MQVQAYNESHERALILLLSKRGMPLFHVEQLPYIGFMVSKDGLPIAFGFLRSIEGGLGMFDSFITNPDCSPSLRHSALDAIYASLFAAAKSSAVTTLLAYTSDESTIQRARRHGFTTIPLTPLAKEL